MIRFTCPCCGKRYKLDQESLPHGTKLFCQSCRKKLIILDDQVEMYGFETAAGEQSHWICCPHCMTEQEYRWTDRGLYRCTVCSKTYFVSSRMPPLPFRVSPKVRNVPPSPPPVSPPPVSPHAPTVAFAMPPVFPGNDPGVKLNLSPSPETVPEKELFSKPSPSPSPDPGVKLNLSPSPETVPEKELFSKPSPSPSPDPGVKLNLSPSPAFVPSPPVRGETVQPEEPVFSGNPLLRFSRITEETAEPVPFRVEVNKSLRIGVRRERKGIAGFFISLSEKLCGN